MSIIKILDMENIWNFLIVLSSRPSLGLHSFINLSRSSQTPEIFSFWKEFFTSLRWDSIQASLEKETYVHTEVVLRLSSGGGLGPLGLAVSSLQFRVSWEAFPGLIHCLAVTPPQLSGHRDWIVCVGTGTCGFSYSRVFFMSCTLPQSNSLRSYEIRPLEIDLRGLMAQHIGLFSNLISATRKI